MAGEVIALVRKWLLGLLIFVSIVVATSNIYYEAFTNRWANYLVYRQLGVLSFFYYDLWDFATGLSNDLSKEDMAYFDNIIKQYNEYRFQGFENNKVKNVITIQMESVDGVFMSLPEQIREKYIPNINQLMSEGMVFKNAFDQTGHFSTSDAEFMVFTGLPPLLNKAIFTHFDLSNVQSLPRLLDGAGFETHYIHGYIPQYWSRDKAISELGFDSMHFIEDMSSREVIGWGISDEAVLQYSSDLIEREERSFYHHITLLTNHTPYDYVKDGPIRNPDSNVEHYLNSVHYTDRVIGNYITRLQEMDVADETLILVYSDHKSGIVEDVYSYFDKTDSYDQGINRIPMLMLNGSGQGTFNPPVSQISVPAIILESLGMETPKSMIGGFRISGKNAIILKDHLKITGNGDESILIEEVDHMQSKITECYLSGCGIDDE